ncbi:patatin-like phospholipase family protein [Paenibacillus farraposensis]|uniref:Patatin-like phospholipase family protein n=1 Tax=Paenibacillus farraposensis TaxID=2807095 RepID=A0ABW4DFK3_9BACL|nr:patatin-like phospholipase family protein [Paenibacillus farraposensis]MCC3379739.1 patatin-like phospholipase family protein [Paenibacillus farraposensis]
MLINAVFQGGGVKGISLAGAVKAAEENEIVFNRVAGTSSGAIVAALLAAGYSADEMKAVIEKTPLVKLLRRSRVFNIKWIGPAARVFLKKGLYSGEALEHWVRELLRAKGVRTFADLPPGKLRIIASDITNGRILVLPEDIKRFGINPSSLEVAKAIRMSTSIPYFFDPVMLRLDSALAKGKTFSQQFVFVVDGALLSNLPLWLFDEPVNEREAKAIPTVGFQMVGRTGTETKVSYIRGPLTMLQAIFDTMLSAHDERYIEQENRYRTIKIPTLGIRTAQFNISPEQSELLYTSGVQAGEAFFHKWSITTYQQQYSKYQLMKNTMYAMK